MIKQLFILLVATFNIVGSNAQNLKNFLGSTPQPITGQDWKMLTSAQKPLIVIFFSPECPICISNTLPLREIIEKNTGKVDIALVFPGDYYSDKKIKQFQSKYKLEVSALRDSKNDLVKFLNAKVTPEVYLFDQTRTLVYSGKLNNQYESVGVRRGVVTENYLSDAISSTLLGKSPLVKTTQAVGCFINK